MGRKAALILAVVALVLLNLGKFFLPLLERTDHVGAMAIQPVPLHVNGQVAPWVPAHALFDGHMAGPVSADDASVSRPGRVTQIRPPSLPLVAPVVVPPPVIPPPPPAEPSQPDIVLVGTLFKDGAWAAFVSRGQDTFLVRQGDMVGDSLRVLSIDAKRVILKGIADGDVLEIK